MLIVLRAPLSKKWSLWAKQPIEIDFKWTFITIKLRRIRMYIKKVFIRPVIGVSLIIGSLSVSVYAHEIKQEPVSDKKEVTTEKLSDNRPSFVPKGKNEAFETDSLIISEKYNWSVKETKQHMLNQDKFGDFVLKIVEKHNDVFASSAMASKPGEEATIWIKGDVGPEIKQRVERFNLRSEMKVNIEDGMRFSFDEQDKRMSNINEILEEQGIMLPGDVIIVSLPASEKFPKTPVPENPDRMTFDGRYQDPVVEKLLSGKIDHRGVYFVFTNEPIDVNFHALGGRRVFGSSGSCTSGFSVERISDSLDGIASAAHCHGIDTFDAISPEANFSLSHRGEHCSSHGDLEWKSSSHLELAEYVAGPDEEDIREVNSRENWYSVNNTYCAYSRINGTRICDQVYSVNVSQGNSGAQGLCGGVTTNRLIAMDGNSNTFGDSGGPWSFSTEAVGIVKGAKWIWFGTRATFSMTTRLDEALGVRVKLQ